MTKPDDDALRVAREIRDIHQLDHADDCPGCAKDDLQVATLIRTLLTERERELREVLGLGVDFFKSGGHPSASWASAWMAEAERLLAR